MSRSTRFPRPFSLAILVCASLLTSDPALAGDAKEVEKSLRLARWALESNQFDESERRVVEADRNLEGLPEAELARLREEIRAFRAEKSAKEIEFFSGPLLKEFTRGLDAAEHDYQRGTEGDGASDVAETMERHLARIEERLKAEDTVKWLTAEQIAEIQAQVTAARARGEQAVRDIHAKRAEKWFAKIEQANQDLANASWDTVRNHLEYAKAEAEKLPTSDPRRADYLARVEKLRATFESGSDSVSRDAEIAGLVELWATIQSSYGSESAGWEGESGPDYGAFSKSMYLGMEKTLARGSLLRRITEDSRYQAAKEKYPDDPTLAALVSELDAATHAAASPIAAVANELLTAVENDEETPDHQLTTALRVIESTLDRQVAQTAEVRSAFARTQSLIQKIADDAAAAQAAHAQLTAEMTAQANALWPKLVAANEDAVGEFVRIEPVAAVADLDAWKGKVVHFTDVNNRAGWDYQYGDYDLIVPIDGVPVGGQFDPALRQEIQRISDATGLRFDSRRIENAIGVIDRHGRIQGISYSQVLQEHVPTVNYQAPLLRIVAVKAGPFAVSLLGDTMAVAAAQAEVGSNDSSGMPWFTLIVVGAMIVVLLKKRERVLSLVRARMGDRSIRSTDELVRSARGFVDRSLSTAKRQLQAKSHSSKES